MLETSKPSGSKPINDRERYNKSALPFPDNYSRPSLSTTFTTPHLAIRNESMSKFQKNIFPIADFHKPPSRPSKQNEIRRDAHTASRDVSIISSGEKQSKAIRNCDNKSTKDRNRYQRRDLVTTNRPINKDVETCEHSCSLATSPLPNLQEEYQMRLLQTHPLHSQPASLISNIFDTRCRLGHKSQIGFNHKPQQNKADHTQRTKPQLSWKNPTLLP